MALPIDGDSLYEMSNRLLSEAAALEPIPKASKKQIISELEHQSKAKKAEQTVHHEKRETHHQHQGQQKPNAKNIKVEVVVVQKPEVAKPQPVLAKAQEETPQINLASEKSAGWSTIAKKIEQKLSEEAPKDQSIADMIEN